MLMNDAQIEIRNSNWTVTGVLSFVLIQLAFIAAEAFRAHAGKGGWYRLALVVCTTAGAWWWHRRFMMTIRESSLDEATAAKLVRFESSVVFSVAIALFFSMGRALF